MFIERITKRQGGKTYTSVLLRENFREDGKVKHRTLANLSKLPPKVLTLLGKAIKGTGGEVNWNDFETQNSREYGASACLLELARKIGLDQVLYSRRESWRDDVLAMICGRIVWQGSKLHLSKMQPLTALWELCGHEDEVDVDRNCYEPMDRLLERQEAIQQQLAKKHLSDGCLILYDITNTWFDGEYEASEIVDYGKGKGGKRGFKQVAIGLIANKDGLPVAVEVFNGRTSDQTTVRGQAVKLAETYGVKDVIFAGDRGMLTPQRIKEIGELGFLTLTALTHPQMKMLFERRVIQPELFDEKQPVEIIDPDGTGVRYMLCKNPETLKRERNTRAGMIEKVNETLAKIASAKRKKVQQKICAKVGALFSRYRIEKFYQWSVTEDGRLDWSLQQDRVDAEAAFDGCYVVRTDAAAETLSTAEAVVGYKSLAGVEKAFRNLKTVLLEIRPVYHKVDRRITAHVFLCMLAYHLQWHMQQRLAPLFAADGEGKNRDWSVERVIETLKAIRIEDCLLCGTKVTTKVSTPDAEQKQIINLLGVKLP